jgi:two-component system sensor histidine kinase/response regulator
LSRQGRRVLVVDDHPVNRLVVVAQLTALGYAAAAADSGETALAALAAEPYDAVLLDCEMPLLDGYETCRRLRQREGGSRRTWVIALTSHTAPGERERCLAAGMDDHLGKTLHVEELAAVLNRRLEGEAAGPAGSDRLEERLAALARLGEQTGEEMLGPVIESFLDQGARDFETMRRALARGDGAALAAAAHSLAGSSGILGAAGLAAGCAELEELARRQDLAACGSRLEPVERAYQAIVRRLPA